MSKKLLFTILVITSLKLHSQEEVTVGTPICGTSITSIAPANYDFVLDKKNSWVNMLYPSSKIRASGNIKGIAFFSDCMVTSNCTFNEAKNQKIFLKEVDSDQFLSTQEPDLSTYTLVFDGNITWKRGLNSVENSKTQIVFKTPFQYSGNKTLAIYFLNENNQALGGFIGCGSSPSFLCFSGEENSLRYENFKKDQKSGTGNYDSVLPIIRLYFDNINIDDFTPSTSKTQITASPTEILANGFSSSLITVQLFNANGDILNHGGHSVSLNTTAGELSSIVDNNDGTYVAYLTSSVLPGTATLSGKLNGMDIDTTVEVEFKKSTDNPIDPNLPMDSIKLSDLVQAFSPNGDGKNDVWRILPNISTKYPNNSLQIFNRKGNLVFRAKPYHNDWGGISEGKLTFSSDSKVAVGPYYFILNTGTEITLKGWVFVNY